MTFGARKRQGHGLESKATQLRSMHGNDIRDAGRRVTRGCQPRGRGKVFGRFCRSVC